MDPALSNADGYSGDEHRRGEGARFGRDGGGRSSSPRRGRVGGALRHTSPCLQGSAHLLRGDGEKTALLVHLDVVLEPELEHAREDGEAKDTGKPDAPYPYLHTTHTQTHWTGISTKATYLSNIFEHKYQQSLVV